MMSCGSNEEVLRSHIGRGVRVGVQHPQYDDTDALNYHHVTNYTADMLSPHIKIWSKDGMSMMTQRKWCVIK